MDAMDLLSRKFNLVFRASKSAAYVPLTCLLTCRLHAAYVRRLRCLARKAGKAPISTISISQDLGQKSLNFGAQKAGSA